MASVSLKKRVVWPVVGAVTAAATIVGGWAPVSQAAPAAGGGDGPQTAKADEAGDGTYESCDAYFGLGKAEDTMDIVSFDVSDENGADGTDHAVGTDTEVIFVLTNDEGDTLECTPSEITETEWDAFIDEALMDMPGNTPMPSFPGPGHYAYPSVPFGPDLDGFGTVTDVGFAVSSVPGEHTLVSPTGVTQLDQHYIDWFEVDVGGSDPRIIDHVATAAGPDAGDALAFALAGEDNCDDDAIPAELSAALDALRAFHGASAADFPDLCQNAFLLHDTASFALAIDATAGNVEPIVLAVPAETEPTVPDTTQPAPNEPNSPGAAQVPASQGATPVAAAPAYTG